MRFRLVERKAGAPRRLPAASAPEKTPPAPPRAADLDNPQRLRPSEDIIF